MKKSQKSEKNIMFYMKNCKNDALLVKNLQRECFFDTRNPRGTLFRAGSLMGSNTPLYYLAHENPYQHSCWGKINFDVFDVNFRGTDLRIRPRGYFWV